MTQVTRSFRYRIYPNAEQRVLLERTFGSCRFVWNRVLADTIQQYEAHKANPQFVSRPAVGKVGLTYNVKPLREEFEWLKEISYCAVQQKLRDLGDAFSNFFGRGKKNKKAGYPKFKKKNSCESFRLIASSHAFRIKEGEFYISKSEAPINVRWSRDLPSEPTSCTISRTPSGEYYVSFVCEADLRPTNGTSIIGFDLGLSHYLVDSRGNKIDNPRHFVSLQRRLVLLQRQLSRKQKGSKNREKSRLKVAKLHQCISNMRDDFLHKLSRTLVNENQVIGIESLKVANMIRNRKLAKHIADAAWGKFITMLKYKAQESTWCTVVDIDPFYPSTHTCSSCDYMLEHKLKLSERSWVCPRCGSHHDRDFNAAKNIRNVAWSRYRDLRLQGGEYVIVE